VFEHFVSNQRRKASFLNLLSLADQILSLLPVSLPKIAENDANEDKIIGK
jgi:hypothetical protein